MSGGSCPLHVKLSLAQLIKDVRRSKRKDWKSLVKQSVTEDMDVRDKWLGIKFLKKKHAPNLYERADMNGRTVNFTTEKPLLQPTI